MTRFLKRWWWAPILIAAGSGIGDLTRGDPIDVPGMLDVAVPGFAFFALGWWFRGMEKSDD